MSTATLPRTAATCPAWCVGCDTPDPGVVVHWSRQWADPDAGWTVTVSQRVTGGTPSQAFVDAFGVDGGFTSTAALIAALAQAQAMADDINRGIR